MDPILVAGRCTLQEVDLATRVFALCGDSKQPQFTPVSLPAESYGHRVIASSQEGKKLLLRVDQFPPTLTRVYLGISVPAGKSLGRQVCQLKLTLDSGADHFARFSMPALGVPYRYALVATLRHREGQWYFRVPENPEYFPDRATLAQRHPVPSWWSSKA